MDDLKGQTLKKFLWEVLFYSATHNSESVKSIVSGDSKESVKINVAEFWGTNRRYVLEVASSMQHVMVKKLVRNWVLTK